MRKKDDSYFIDKVRKGKTEAFRYLVERHKDMVFTIALRIVRNREDAEEIAQDVFIKAHQSLDSFKGISKFTTWLYRIAYNLSISNTRKKNYNTVDIDENLLSEQDIFKSFNELTAIEQAEKKQIVNEALDRLNEDEKLIITLYYSEDLSVKEICEITDLTKSNVKVKLFRTRNKLFNLLNEKKDLLFVV